MKDSVYLRIDRGGVRGMTKGQPQTARGEICARIVIEVDDGAFGAPVIEQYVHIESWANGLDVGDALFKNPVITQEEADTIKAARIRKMAEILADQGAVITWPDADAET